MNGSQNKNRGRKRLIKNDTDDEEGNQAYQKPQVQETFEKFQMIDQEKEGKEQITTYLNKNGGKITPLKKGPTVFEAADTEQPKKMSYANAWGDEEEIMSDDSSSPEFNLESLANITRTTIAQPSTQRIEEEIPSQESASTRGKENTKDGKDQPRQQEQAPVTTSRTKQFNALLNQPILQPQATEKAQAITIKPKDHKVFEKRHFTLIDNELKECKLITRIIKELGGMFVPIQLLSKQTICIVGEKGLPEKYNKQRKHLDPIIYEADLDEYLLKECGKSLNTLGKEFKLIEDIPEKPAIKPKRAPIQETDKPFFGKPAREIQQTDVVTTVLQVVDEVTVQQKRRQQWVLNEQIPNNPVQTYPPAKQLNGNSQLWTEKYKPKRFTECISNEEVLRKLYLWIKNWGQDSGAQNSCISQIIF